MNRKKSFLRKWMGQLSLIIIVTILLSSVSYGQANYWSVFSALAGGISPGCNLANRMTCLSAPSPTSSFSSISASGDYFGGAGDPEWAGTNYYQNSVYDNSGNVLFSVNTDGIYDASGVLQFDFNGSPALSYTIGGTSYTYTPKYAVSEIAMFPASEAPGNNRYWLVFWAFDSPLFAYFTYYNTYDLRAIQVTVNPSGLSFSDNVLYDASGTNNLLPKYAYATADPFSFAVAADASACGNTRNVYTLEPITVGTVPGGGSYAYSNLRKWTFTAGGILPSPSVSTFIKQELEPAFSPKAKILTIGSDRYFAYISGDNFYTAGSINYSWGVTLDKYQTAAARQALILLIYPTVLIKTIFMGLNMCLPSMVCT